MDGYCRRCRSTRNAGDTFCGGCGEAFAGHTSETDLQPVQDGLIETSTPMPAPGPAHPSLPPGWGVAALIVGVFGYILNDLVVIPIAGIILSLVASRESGKYRWMAWTGGVLSVIGLALALYHAGATSTSPLANVATAPKPSPTTRPATRTTTKPEPLALPDPSEIYNHSPLSQDDLAACVTDMTAQWYTYFEEVASEADRVGGTLPSGTYDPVRDIDGERLEAVITDGCSGAWAASIDLYERLPGFFKFAAEDGWGQELSAAELAYHGYRMCHHLSHFSNGYQYYWAWNTPTESPDGYSVFAFLDAGGPGFNAIAAVARTLCPDQDDLVQEWFANID